MTAETTLVGMTLPILEIPIFFNIHILIVGLSAVCHLINTILALRLIKITGIKTAWIFMTAAIVIQLVRRTLSFWTMVTGASTKYNINDEILALTISVLMLVGLALIAPLFLSIRRSEEEMKLSRNKAEEERAKTESIIAAIGDGISIQDKELNILYQNNIHKKIFNDHKGKKCYSAYRGMPTPCDECPVLMSLKDGEIHTIETNKPLNGGFSYFEITTSPIRNADGEIVAAIELVKNIDLRKSMENERENLICKLKGALASIKTLRGFIPICASCKKIRDDKGYWNQLESYIREHSEAEFSHGICPDCAQKLYPEYYRKG